MQLTRGMIGTFLAVIFLINCSYFYLLPTFTRLQDRIRSYDNTAGERRGSVPVLKVSMLYGDDPHPVYQKALENHERHAQRWGCSMEVLRQDLVGGMFNKPAYLLSLVLQELQKPPSEQAKWLMWVDADSIILNPAVPPDTFLPPPDIPEIHMFGGKDLVGLNAGVLYFRVHNWTVDFLVETLRYSSNPPKDDQAFLDWQEQTAMAYLLKRPSTGSEGRSYREGNVFIPREWINSYVNFDKERRKKGDMLLHFPGMGEARYPDMAKWLDITGRTPNEWEVPLEQTEYPERVSQFWNQFRTVRDALKSAEEGIRHAPQGTPTSARAAAASLLKIALEEFTHMPEFIQQRLDELQAAVSQETKQG